MSTRETDLLLLGNVVVDEIFTVREWPREGTSNTMREPVTAIGGLGNMAMALKDSGLRIKLYGVVGSDAAGEMALRWCERILGRGNVCAHHTPLPTSRAVIIVNESSGERTSFVRWGGGNAVTGLRGIPRARWTHLAYLDVLMPISMTDIIKSADFVSADFCLSHPATLRAANLLPCCDYIITSEKEAIPYGGARALSGTKQASIVHSILSSVVCDGRGTRRIVVDVDTMINVVPSANTLGAGDAYAAHFIASRLKGESLDESVLAAHKGASKFVAERTKKPWDVSNS